MEIRRKLIADYKPDFLNNNFEKLEDSLTREFLNYFWKLLPLKSKYTGWLSQKVRTIVNIEVFNDSDSMKILTSQHQTIKVAVISIIDNCAPPQIKYLVSL